MPERAPIRWKLNFEKEWKEKDSMERIGKSIKFT